MLNLSSQVELLNNNLNEIFNLEVVKILKQASIKEPLEEIDLNAEIFTYTVTLKQDLFIQITFDLLNINDLYHTKLVFIDENYKFDKYSINIHEFVGKDIVEHALKLHETILNILEK